MKYYTIILFIFFYLKINSQTSNKEYLKLQKHYFSKANKALKLGNAYQALWDFHMVMVIDLKTKKEEIAKQKIDSLFPIYQKIEARKWIGTWILKQLKTNKFNYEKIVITNKNIFFYDKKNDSIAKRTERIKFTKYNPNDLVNLNCVIFENNEIWEFRVKKTNNETRLFPYLKVDIYGESIILLDERSMIKNSLKRKQELAKEIRTFYARQ